MLYNGEQIGDGSPPAVDIAVDPLEGTTLTAKGMPNALAVHRAVRARARCSTRARASTWRRSPAAREIADLLDLDRPIGETRQARRRAQGHRRARRDGRRARPPAPRGGRSRRSASAGARVRLISDGDVSAAMLAVSDDSPVDLLWGIGGTPEGVISAARAEVHGRPARRPAVAARRRGAQGRARRRLRPRARAHRRRPRRAATTASSRPPASPTATSCRACATRARGAATTESLVMRSRSGTVRRVSATPRPREAARAHRRRYG